MSYGHIIFTSVHISIHLYFLLCVQKKSHDKGKRQLETFLWPIVVTFEVQRHAAKLQ